MSLPKLRPAPIAGAIESPFLDEELLAPDETVPQWKARSAIAIASPFQAGVMPEAARGAAESMALDSQSEQGDGEQLDHEIQGGIDPETAWEEAEEGAFARDLQELDTPPAAPRTEPGALVTVTLHLNPIKLVSRGNAKAHKKNPAVPFVQIEEAPAVFLPAIVKRAQALARQNGKAALAAALDPDRWFTRFTQITFLGRPLKHGNYVHVELAKVLAAIEAELVQRLGGTPKQVGDTLLHGSDEGISGSRKTSSTATYSMHMFGLAVDVNYRGNPFIETGDIPILNRVLRNASALLRATDLAYARPGTVPAAYDEVQLLDKLLEQYFALLDDPATLRVQTVAATRTPWKGMDVTAARQIIEKDLNELAQRLARGVTRNPRTHRITSDLRPYFKAHGLLDFDKRFVLAMVNGGLHWGAMYGDVMHFDMRSSGVGRYIEQARNEYAARARTALNAHFKAKEYGYHSLDEAPASNTSVHEQSSEMFASEYDDELAAEAEDGASAEEAFERPWAEESEQDLEHAPLGELEEYTDDEAPQGESPATDAPPLLQVTAQYEPPGQTIYVEIPLGKDSRCVQWTGEKANRKCVKYQSFVVKPMTGIFIPERYAPQSKVDLILYLHGHKAGVPGSDAVIAEYWNGRKFPVFGLREELNASGKNVILVAPTLAMKSEGGDLLRARGLDRYLAKVMAALMAYGPYKNRSPQLGSIILAAHSGGGMYMRRLATSDNSTAANVRECWGFDSLYNSGDVIPWRQWAAKDSEGRHLYSYYLLGLPKTNSERLRRNARGRSEPLPNVHPIAVDEKNHFAVEEKNHFKMIRPALRARLAATALLKDTAGSAGAMELCTAEETDEHFDGAADPELLETLHDGDAQDYLEEEKPLNAVSVTLLRDDLTTPLDADEIIGLDSVSTGLNVQIIAVSADTPDPLSIDLVIRTPGKSGGKIVTRSLKIPKHGTDPADAANAIFKVSVSKADLDKLLVPIDNTKEVATVRRIGGTSDARLIRALGRNWQARGQAQQADKCGIASADSAAERPDALKLMQAGGVAVLELKDAAGTVLAKQFIRNPADILYYTGHGLGRGFSQRVGASSVHNCLAIEDHAATDGYCCWAMPSDLAPYWKSPMDLDLLIVAGCSVLAVDGSTGTLEGDGLAWAKLMTWNSGPLRFLLGYGDYDANENSGTGPMGATAPLDAGGGNEIAAEIGGWIKANPKLTGIIRAWLMINMAHQNPFGIGFDKDGFCWRTRRKSTRGWTPQETLVTKDKIRYVIEKRKIT